jgi:Tfp pilus assembly PilM family ATPase
MIRTTASLPLGIDIGSARIRIVEAEATRGGIRIRNAVVRDVAAGAASSGVVADPEYVAMLLDDALQELGCRERRCVCAIGEPDAFIRSIHFPKMSHPERLRNAQYEARRYVAFAPEDTVVRLRRCDASPGEWALGVARASAVAARAMAVRRAKLKPVAMDHESLALFRALPEYDAVIDVGLNRTNLHVRAGRQARTLVTFSGGADITRGIANDLSIDTVNAERRKRILGTAGAGEKSVADLVCDIASLIANARTGCNIEKVALVGNGARLPGLCERIAVASSTLCRIPVSRLFADAAQNEDVIRAAAPDWTLAAALGAYRQ